MVGLRLEPSGLTLACVFLHCSSRKGLPGLNQEVSLEAGVGWGVYKARGTQGGRKSGLEVRQKTLPGDGEFPGPRLERKILAQVWVLRSRVP